MSEARSHRRRGKTTPTPRKAVAPAEKRSDDDPPKRFRRRETPVPLVKRSKPQSSFRAHEVKASTAHQEHTRYGCT